MFTAAGCEEVRTYIQSGNVLFRAAPEIAALVPSRVGALIEKQFGFVAPVLLRTSEELDDVVRHNPYLAAGAAEERLYVVFLAGAPTPQDVERLDPDRSPPDTFAVRGREVYLRVLLGAGRSKLTHAYFESKLGTIGTARNWRTVTTLLTLMRE